MSPPFLGGAHSLVLAEANCPAGLANPWGTRRAIYAWGYGANGQLGNDQIQDRPTPVRCKMPNGEVVAELAAGKAHSLALTLHGDLYAWGKGWMGEAPRGDLWLRLSKTVAETRASGRDAPRRARALTPSSRDHTPPPTNTLKTPTANSAQASWATATRGRASRRRRSSAATNF